MRPKPSRSLCAELRAAFAECVKDGKTALTHAHRQQVEPVRGVQIHCSIDLDECLSAAHPNSPRWDYILIAGDGLSRSVGVEIHAATAGEVRSVVAKRDWARGVLISRAGNCTPSSADWYWVASGKVFLRATDPQFRVLQRSGIKGPMRRLGIG